MPESQKWEYAELFFDENSYKEPQWSFELADKVEHSGSGNMLAVINQYGMDGWEAICTVPSKAVRILLKRPLVVHGEPRVTMLGPDAD